MAKMQSDIDELKLKLESVKTGDSYNKNYFSLAKLTKQVARGKHLQYI